MNTPARQAHTAPAASTATILRATAAAAAARSSCLRGLEGLRVLATLYRPAHEDTSLALGVRIRGRTVLTDSLAGSLNPPTCTGARRSQVFRVFWKLGEFGLMPAWASWVPTLTLGLGSG